MINDEGWSKWYDHDGTSCPMPVGTHVQTVDNLGQEMEGFCTDSPSWYKENNGVVVNHPPYGEYLCRTIVKYRYKKPKALLDIIKKAKSIDIKPPLLLPAPVPEEILS
jgi:TusA-related sulfurtransferase